MSYIDLNRSFVPISKDHEFDENDFDHSFFYGDLSKIHWPDLLKLKRVIILAEAGVGKTEEIRMMTNRIRTSGGKAFFLRLEHLCDDFDIAFDVGDADEYKDWLISDETAWFFLDSVDEARMSNPKHFETAIRKLSIKLGGHKQRAKVCITSRPSEWRAKSDIALIQTQLPYFEASEYECNQNHESTFFDGRANLSAQTKHVADSEPIAPSVFAIQTLNNEQKMRFAEGSSVNNPESFLVAIEKNEADIFSDTPQDLIELISYWNSKGVISNRAKMIEFGINSKLAEVDPDRASALSLTAKDALHGAKRLAAAATFLRTNRILVPDQSHETAIKKESINPRSILNDWDEKKCRALLLRPIFDEAIYGSVRFHHRSTREYLTARWLYDLLQSGKSRRSIEALFFSKRYGVHVSIPSMRPVLAWLILWDDRMRQRTVEISPEVLLQGGDPSALPTTDRQILLNSFCQFYDEQNIGHLSFDIAEVKRFAHPDLGHMINQLMAKYSDNDDVVELLLRMVWQGEIKDCASAVLKKALDAETSAYRRMYAIQALASIGSVRNNQQFIVSVLAEKELENERIISEIISGFAPDYLDIEGVISLLTHIRNRDRYSASSFYYFLEEFIQHKCPENKLIQWIHGALALLKKKPVIEKRFFELSQDYAWLLPVAALAAERLVKEHSPDALNSEVLEVISLTQSSRYYDSYRSSQHTLDKLVPEHSELNHSLFWFDVELARNHLDRKKGERLIEWWQVNSLDNYWRFDSSDFERLLEDMQAKVLLDDQLVALSLAFNVYQQSGRGDNRRRAMWKAVKGIEDLESTLRTLLNPPAMTKEQRQSRRKHSGWKLKQKKQEEMEAKDRKDWTVWLKEHTDVLRDSSIAGEGNVWNDTQYLMDILREKSDRGQWAQTHWETLISEFGSDVAEAFRDGCISYWRNYIPEMRSEDMENPNRIPFAVNIGLSGLGMEVRHTPEWPSKLSESEAHLVSRYALKEVNGFPDWAQCFYQAFPAILALRLEKEIEWEFSTYEGEQPCCYVLSNITRIDWFLPRLSKSLLDMLNKYDPKHDQSVENALNVVLSSPCLDTDKFVQLSKHKINKNTELSRQALWLAAWACVEANRAIDQLVLILSGLDKEKATMLSMLYIMNLVGDRHGSSLKSAYEDYKNVSILLSLIKLMHTYIHHSEDIKRSGEGVYSPGLRDHAQDARDLLFRLLMDIPGKETYLALMDLAHTHPDTRSRDWYVSHAKLRAELDAELIEWDSEDISRFANESEKIPQNNRDIFDLTVSRLNDLKDDLEGGDSSNAELLNRSDEERLHRIYIGGWLREHSRGQYSVPQEEEMADRKKPDIRIHHPSIDAPVPIELKVADNWSGADLLERLENQLCGQYLRGSRTNCGIFLLTYCGKKEWRNPITKKGLDFLGLIQLLQMKADEIEASNSMIESIEVIGIDLTKRNKKITMEHS